MKTSERTPDDIEYPFESCENMMRYKASDDYVQNLPPDFWSPTYGQPTDEARDDKRDLLLTHSSKGEIPA